MDLASWAGFSQKMGGRAVRAMRAVRAGWSQTRVEEEKGMVISFPPSNATRPLKQKKSPSPYYLSPPQLTKMVRFLDLISPLTPYLPQVEASSRRVPFREVSALCGLLCVRASGMTGAHRCRRKSFFHRRSTTDSNDSLVLIASSLPHPHSFLPSACCGHWERCSCS